MTTKVKEIIKIAVVSLITAIAVKHISIDWAWLPGLLANDFIKGILAFGGGALLVLIITKIKKRR